MTRINLLPWREAHREEKKREFLVVLGGFVFGALFSVLIWDRWVNSDIDEQTSRNEFLRVETAKLDKEVKEINELKIRLQEMLERMTVIQGLQSNRPETVKIFDEFVRSVPDGVFFTAMIRAGDNLSLTGFAESNNRISALMRKLNDSPKFKDPNLTKVEADETLGEQGSRFEMQVKLRALDQMLTDKDNGEV